MRYLIVVLLYLCCHSLSLNAKKAQVYTKVKNSAEKLIHFSKKQKNSVKTELNSNKTDFLNHNHQNQSLIATAPVKPVQGSIIYASKINFDYNLNPLLFYNFIFQYLYPKHSFW